MKSFTCSCPTHPSLFFESTSCETCGNLVGFSDLENEVLAFKPISNSEYFTPVSDKPGAYRQCQNYLQYNICNGMISVDPDLPFGSQETLCRSCSYTKTIPDLSIAANIPLWRRLETAKRRTLFTLQQLNLLPPNRNEDPECGLCFHFLADKTVDDHFRTDLPNHDPVFTGHDKGVITINLAEADEVARTDTKITLGENYRTLLGHFRHEIGHYFWDQLLSNNPEELVVYRQLFGDEREDYQAALDRYYKNGPPDDWRKNYISAYATMHPWEDWAETWAHYLHMLDTLETAKSFGLKVAGNPGSKNETNIKSLNLPQQASFFSRESPIDKILQAWIDFSVVLNSLNRSLGLADAYPFVLYPKIRENFKFIHNIVHLSIH